MIISIEPSYATADRMWYDTPYTKNRAFGICINTDIKYIQYGLVMPRAILHDRYILRDIYIRYSMMGYKLIHNENITRRIAFNEVILGD